MFAFPNQRLTYLEKTKNNKEWANKMVDYLAKYGYTQTSSYNTMISNYRLYNNIVDQKDFERDCNVMGIDVGQFQDIILPYNKTYNKIQVLLSDEMVRPYKYIVALLDPNSIKKKEIAKTDMLKSWIESQIGYYTVEYQQKKLEQLKAQYAKQQEQAVKQAQSKNPLEQQSQNQDQALQAQQQRIQEEEEQLKLMEQEAKAHMDSLVPPEEIEKWHTTKYRDSREIASSKIMEYLEKELRIKEKKNDAFKHGLLSGIEAVYVGASEESGLILDVINSPDFFYHKSPDTKYAQDGLYAGRRRYMTMPDIIQKYSKSLTKEQYTKLTDKAGANMFSSSGNTDFNTMHYPLDSLSTQYEQSFFFDLNNTHNYTGQYDKRKGPEWQVVETEWVSERKVGFITFTNNFGDQEVEMVDENFMPPKDAIVETKENGNKRYFFNITNPESGVTQEMTYEENWVPQVWEGVRIGSDIYVNVRPKKYAYFSINNVYKRKLGYHAVVYSNTNADPVSLMDRMRPFQLLYFFVWHKVRKLIAQDKGRLFHFDTTMLPENMSLEKYIYYLDELNMDFYNPLRNVEVAGGYNRSKVTSSTDRSNMQHIAGYIELLNFIDNMISDAAGITRQREGQTKPNQAVGNAQSDIAQSALVTEIYFSTHATLWEDILNSLLSISRKYFKDNNINHLQYMMDDLSLQTIKLAEDDLEEADLGLFVTDSVKENFVFETLKQISQALIQNDKANLSHVISMLEANSLAELKREIKVFEKEQQDAAQGEQQHQMQMQQDAQAFARETMLMKEKAVTDREIRKAEIMVFARQQDLDQNNDGIPDPLEIEKLKMERDFKGQELELKKVELGLKGKEIDQKIEIERIKARNKPTNKK